MGERRPGQGQACRSRGCAPVPPPCPPPGPMTAAPDDIFAPEARTAFAAAGHTIENVRRTSPNGIGAGPLRPVGPRRGHAPLRRCRDGRRRPTSTACCSTVTAASPTSRWPCAAFPCQPARAPDDFGPDALAAQLAALDACGLQAFELQNTRLASFTSAPFLAVHDVEGGIARLRQALGSEAHAPTAPTPHVTVGLYSGAWPTAEVLPASTASTPARRCGCTIDRQPDALRRARHRRVAGDPRPLPLRPRLRLKPPPSCELSHRPCMPSRPPVGSAQPDRHCRDASSGRPEVAPLGFPRAWPYRGVSIEGATACWRWRQGRRCPAPPRRPPSGNAAA